MSNTKKYKKNKYQRKKEEKEINPVQGKDPEVNFSLFPYFSGKLKKENNENSDLAKEIKKEIIKEISWLEAITSQGQEIKPVLDNIVDMVLESVSVPLTENFNFEETKKLDLVNNYELFNNNNYYNSFFNEEISKENVVDYFKDAYIFFTVNKNDNTEEFLEKHPYLCYNLYQLISCLVFIKVSLKFYKNKNLQDIFLYNVLIQYLNFIKTNSFSKLSDSETQELTLNANLLNAVFYNLSEKADFSYLSKQDSIVVFNIMKTMEYVIMIYSL